MLRATPFAIPLVLLFLAGCAPSTDVDPNTEVNHKPEVENAEDTANSEVQTGSSDNSDTPNEDITVEFMAWKDITEKLIPENEGKVVVVDLWNMY